MMRLHKNIHWWNNDGDMVRLVNSSGDVVMKKIVKDTSSLRVCN